MTSAGSTGPKRRAVSAFLWTIAVIVALAAGVFQRMVGPTRPQSGAAAVEGVDYHYRLLRSHAGPENYRVEIPSPRRSLSDLFHRDAAVVPPLDPALRGILMHRRRGTNEEWTLVEMSRDGGKLFAEIPLQPPGGKVAYRVYLYRDLEDGATGAAASGVTGGGTRRMLTAADLPAGSVAVPAAGPVVLRFRGSVPAVIVALHVIFIFAGMLWAIRAGLEGLRPGADTRRLTFVALALLTIGGFAFGPLMQWYAFGKFWTGVPFGWDLTDNKTLVVVLAWLGAWILLRRASRRGDPSRARFWVVGAMCLTLVVFSIPHSVIGSELDYATGKVVTTR